MTEGKEKNKESEVISRREFLKDAGLVVGGAAIGSAVLLAACKGGEETTATVTKTVGGGGTITATVTSPPVTKTVTVTGDGAAAPANVVKFTVNKKAYEVPVEPEDTLHSVLREKLGITSTKDMCNGYGACGSCTVIVDGRPILSCMTLAIECGGALIETAEGIADAGHPLVAAYIKNYCMQCGYCTPGFILTAKALLDRKPKATEADIRKILGGNICRCGTYPAHIKAVLEVAK